MSSTAASARLTFLWETPKTLWGSLTTVDHKTLGLRYLMANLGELGARAESLDRPAVAVAMLAGEFERARDALLAFSANPARPRASA